LILEIEKKRFTAMLKKLLIGEIFTTVNITVENVRLTSRQCDNSGTLYRIVVFKEPYFNFIYGSDSFNVDAKKIYKEYLKTFPSGLIKVDKKGDKLYFTSGKMHCEIETSEYEEDEIPFSFRDNVPVFDNTTELDVYFKVGRKDFFTLTRPIKHYCENLNIVIENGVVVLRKFHEKGSFYRKPIQELFHGDELNLTFGENLRNLEPAFSENEIYIHAKTNLPIWITEETDDYALGIMVYQNEANMG
jgi:hypothetical protein